MLWSSLDGSGVWGRMDTCISTIESLHYSPETITGLLIGYTAIQNENIQKLKKTQPLVNSRLALAMGGCHLPLSRIKSCAAAAADLQHPQRNSGWRAEMRYSVLGRKLVGQVFRYVFSGGADSESNFCISSYLEKH